ncbi:cyclic nucleotide-binding domain-containing protein [Paenibacillus sp. M1]|uniref:Cyclic nucleotide-binding domain-containing protein n=1 Tax=Paenibacillus haidiansis TaxID=1574488 RepID=A0ABU7VPR9_9BACL
MKETRDTEQIHAYLRTFRIDSAIPEDLKPHLSLCRFGQGEFICTQGEPAGVLYILVKGKIKIYTTSAEGKTLILSFKSPVEIIGDIEYVQGGDIINTVEAVTSVDMIGISYRWLRKFANDDPKFLQFLLDIVTRKFLIKSNDLSFNLMYPVEVRLASYLLSVCFDGTDALLQGRLSTSDLKDAANLIGVSYRHLNRVLYQFCAEGLTERTKDGIIVINRDGLTALTSHNIYE